MKNQSFNELAIHTSKGSHILIAFVGSVGRILSISKGRDKFLGLIQHMSDLYKKCMIDYLSAYRTKEWPVSVKNANSLQQAIKEGRKLLRLFKWIEELGKVGSKIRVKTKFIILLKVFRHFIGICYYFIDNSLWIIHIGIIFKHADVEILEKVKDALSLLRYLFRMIIFSLTYNEKLNHEKILINSLISSHSVLKLNTYQSSVLDKAIGARSKRRFQTFEMIINILRFLMLAKSLKLPGFKHISSIFQSICGIVSGTFSLFKLLTRNLKN